MGTPMTEARPLEDWAAISSQNRWQGVIFAGEHDARIVPIVRPKDNRVAMNAQWSVQSKGSLITQKLKHHEGGAEMIVWMSKEGLSAPVEENGMVFVEAEGAYAAIRVATGGFKWMVGEFETDRFVPENATMPLRDDVCRSMVSPWCRACSVGRASRKSMSTFTGSLKRSRPCGWVIGKGCAQKEKMAGWNCTI
jgi:hypothetical protein